jgi:hypothetical protein
MSEPGVDSDAVDNPDAGMAARANARESESVNRE